MIPALLLAAALSHPATSSAHELTAGVGYGTQGPILVASWTGRRRWGAWFRVDQSNGTQQIIHSTQVNNDASSIGAAWRALPRLTVGIGYGEKHETTTVYGAVGDPSNPVPIVLEEHQDDEHGLAAMGTWTFPINETLGVAVSATAGPGGLGAAAGVTFFFP